MVLLPLVHAAADAGCARVSLDARRKNDRTEIAVHASCTDAPPGWSDEALHVVREALRHYVGPDASLTVSQGEAGFVATVSFASSGALLDAAQRAA